MSHARILGLWAGGIRTGRAARTRHVDDRAGSLRALAMLLAGGTLAFLAAAWISAATREPSVTPANPILTSAAPARQKLPASVSTAASSVASPSAALTAAMRQTARTQARIDGIDNHA